MIAKLRHLLNYRMAFSSWLWLYALSMITLVVLSLLPDLAANTSGLRYSLPFMIALVALALFFTFTTIGYFRSFMGRIERFAQSVAGGNLQTPLPRKLDQGEVARILNSLNDMQAQLRDTFLHLRSEEQSNALLVQAINQSTSSVMVTDLQARIIYVNDAFVDNSGYQREDILGHTPKLLQSGKTPPEVYQKMRALLLQGESWRGELINKRRDGSEFIETVTITPVRDSDGAIYRYMALKEDITEIRRAQDSIERLAYFDPLTDLPNRRYFLDQLNRRIAHGKRHKGTFALLFIDLNRFKEINDSQGHVVGDQVLMQVAERFAAQVRSEDVLARLGGDEFVLLIDETEPDLIMGLAKRLMSSLRYGVKINAGSFEIGASIGVALYPRHGTNSADLLRHADIAMYESKRGQGKMVIYDRAMSEKVEREVVIATHLQAALREGKGLILNIQAQVNLATGALSGAEILLRWEDELIGAVSPADFIPVAEERGLIATLDRFVIEQSCLTLAAWKTQGQRLPVPLSVNVSMGLFEEVDFIQWLQACMRRHQVEAKEIELEITESGLMHNPAKALEVSAELGQMGISLAIDDFGTGYSSLSYLKQFNASKVKIDQSFIRHIEQDARSQTIVSATISMVRELGMKALAEGVETDAEAAFLLQQGCQHAQGYKYARPVLLSEFANRWLPRH
ncbi:MAG: EAL domain-containing protein [Idiomarina sp.]|nr:EAL domain-containing protein [Idiomarina sp.]